MSNKYLNKTYTNKQGLNYKIVHYNTYYDIIVMFDSGYIKSATMKEVKRNAIKDKLSPSVYGVGIVGIRYNTKVDGKHAIEYGTWKNMLRRCYSEKCRQKFQSYNDCTVSENFKKYSYFYEWCEQQKGFNTFDENGNIFELDKDLLFKDNKLYSEYTCVFLPKEVNALVTWYKDYKNENDMCIKEYTLLTLAEKWKDKIDERAYQALKNFLYT